MQLTAQAIRHMQRCPCSNQVRFSNSGHTQGLQEPPRRNQLLPIRQPHTHSRLHHRQQQQVPLLGRLLQMLLGQQQQLHYHHLHHRHRNQQLLRMQSTSPMRCQQLAGR